MKAPLLCFAVDVEEDMPGWRVQRPVTTLNAERLPRLAQLCREEGIRPTWLCTYPMVTQPSSRAVLSALARSGDSELGTHLHPWNTPPFESRPGLAGDERDHAYYMSALDLESFRAKLAELHGAVAQVAGREPTSFRAGRFGIDHRTMGCLSHFGYRVDSSVTPLVHHHEDGGPDFRFAPQQPYRPSAEDVCKPGQLPILELPVSVTLTRRLPSALSKLYLQLPRRARLRGLLSRDGLRMLDFAWLYPARFELPLMRQAAWTLNAAGNPLLNVFLHSSELLPGNSPHVRTEAEVDSCLLRLRGIFRYAREQLGARPATLSEAGEQLEAHLPPAGPRSASPRTRKISGNS